MHKQCQKVNAYVYLHLPTSYLSALIKLIMNAKFWWMLPVALIGCSGYPREEYNIRIAEDDFSEDEIAQIELAASMWVYVAEANIHLTFSREQGPLYNRENTWTIQRVSLPSNYWAATYWNGNQARIEVAPDTNGDIFFAVILHESGHAFGLSHLPQGHVMEPVADSTMTVPTKEDIKAFCQLHTCNK